MPYSSFTLAQVERQFDLNVVKGVFFSDLPRLPARSWFKESLEISAPFAATQGNEKVRSELIIAPLLFELRELLDRQIGLFSGVDFTIEPESGLNGVCDFLLTRSSNELIIKAPAIVLIEAKKGELNAGWGQCAAEMIAAQKFNQAAAQEVSTIYGSVTTGTQWQFLKLTGQDLTIDVTEYPGLPIFLRRQFDWTSLVRLSDPCVSGGSTTTTIVPQASFASTNSHSQLGGRPAQWCTDYKRIRATSSRSCKAVLQGRGFYPNF